MKTYKVFYNRASGLTQVGERSAYCYIFKDGFFHFYTDETSKINDTPYKSINKDAVLCIEDISPV